MSRPLTIAIAAAAFAYPAESRPAAEVPLLSPPEQWHSAAPITDTPATPADWWRQFDDPLLADLVAAAERSAGRLADARARVAAARASVANARGALLPTTDRLISGSRGVSGPDEIDVAEIASVGRFSWEIDVFGSGRAGKRAALAELESAELDWHGARTVLAAETATTYVSLRACEAQAALAADDAESRAATAGLAAESVASGLESPANRELAEASAAKGRLDLARQRLACERDVKALVALTGIDEPLLRATLDARTGQVPTPAVFGVASIPAAALAQRPDVARAERAVVAASARSRQARAARWPRIALNGNVGRTRIETDGIGVRSSTWDVGPLSIVLPEFDAGRRKANVAAAAARHQAAVDLYAAALRDAVREVEQALESLASATARNEDAERAARGYRSWFDAVAARYDQGAANLAELEDARRTDIAARAALLDEQHTRVIAWIDLYRALGGGWDGRLDLPTL